MKIGELKTGQMYQYPEDILNDIIPRTFMVIGVVEGNDTKIMILNFDMGVAIPYNVMYPTKEHLNKEIFVVDRYFDNLSPEMRRAYPIALCIPN